jgi:hypothetical protein
LVVASTSDTQTVIKEAMHTTGLQSILVYLLLQFLCEGVTPYIIPTGAIPCSTFDNPCRHSVFAVAGAVAEAKQQ